MTALQHLLGPLAGLRPALLATTVHADLVLAAAGTGLWLAALWLVHRVTGPGPAPPLPPSDQLGPEPPAIAGLLTSGWHPTVGLIRATILDLAARGHLAVEQDRDGVLLRAVERRPGDLGAWEQRVLVHVVAAMRDGVTPARRLGFRRSDSGSRWWWRGFKREVLADAEALGLATRPRRSGTLVPLIVGAAVPTALLLPALSVFAVLGGLVLVGLAARLLSVRSTAAGRAAEARWLALRAWLHANPSFAAAPPWAVDVWGRHLAYGVALRVAPAAARLLPFRPPHGVSDELVEWAASAPDQRPPTSGWAPVRDRPPIVLSGPSGKRAAGMLGALGDLMAKSPAAREPMDAAHQLGDDPAKLLTAAEVAHALGGPVQGPAQVEQTGALRFVAGRACEWRAGPGLSFRLRVLSFTSGMNLDLGGLARPVPGIGDRAYVHDNVVTVVRGSAGVHLVLEGVDPVAREAPLLALARLAAPRLGTASLLRDVLQADAPPDAGDPFRP